jgi:uncharacterized membrane protein
MYYGPIELTVAAFPNPEGASKAMNELKQANQAGLIGIDDMAIVVKDAEGKTKITDSKHRTGKGLLTGGVIGGVIALLSGPVGMGAAVAGGALGALAGRIRSLPIRAELKDIGKSLIPNSSAIVAVIEHTWVADIERELAARGARIVHDTLHSDITSQLEAGGNVQYGVVSGKEGAAVERATLTKEEAPAAVAGAR